MGDQGAGEMQAIEVSGEMLALLGTGAMGEHRWPVDPVVLEIHFGDARTPASIRFHRTVGATLIDAEVRELRLIQVVARSACERVLGAALDWEDDSLRYLPASLQMILLAIRDCSLPPAAAEPYRLAKNIELFCELMTAQRLGTLGEEAPAASLSAADRKRIAEARQLIEQNWREKLTLELIARQCGINRGKLARGFRELYQCTVTEALAERRLAEARRQLIATDLPVALIGYHNGYHNNAAFTRAFGRRFGVTPSSVRAVGIAA